MSQALNPTQMLWLEHARKQEEDFIRKQKMSDTARPSPVPERAEHPGQFWQPKTNAPYTYAVNPALTTTAPSPQVVQWTQGNRVIMRPETREVMPGETMNTVKILR